MNTPKPEINLYKSELLIAKTEIKSLLDSFVSTRKSESTATAYRKDLTIFLAFMCKRLSKMDLKLSDIPVSHIQEFKSFLENAGNSPSTVNRRLGSVKSLFAWASENKHIRPIDLSSVKLPKAIPASDQGDIGLGDLKKLLLLAPSRIGYKDVSHRLILHMVLELNLNRSEVVNLRRSDLTGETLRVVGRGEVERTITLPESLQKNFNEYLASFPTPLRPDDYLIQTEYQVRNTRPMDGSTVYRIIERYSCGLNLPKRVNPRSIRRAGIRNKVTTRSSSERVAVEMGYSSIRTMDKYRKGSSP